MRHQRHLKNCNFWILHNLMHFPTNEEIKIWAIFSTSGHYLIYIFPLQRPFHCNFLMKWYKSIQWDQNLPNYDFSSDGLNYVQSSMFYFLKPKIGWSNLIIKSWTFSSLFDVHKTDVRVCSRNDLANIVRAF